MPSFMCNFWTAVLGNLRDLGCNVPNQKVNSTWLSLFQFCNNEVLPQELITNTTLVYLTLYLLSPHYI